MTDGSMIAERLSHPGGPTLSRCGRLTRTQLAPNPVTTAP
jgi:hypothetical protein